MVRGARMTVYFTSVTSRIECSDLNMPKGLAAISRESSSRDLGPAGGPSVAEELSAGEVLMSFLYLLDAF